MPTVKVTFDYELEELSLDLTVEAKVDREDDSDDVYWMLVYHKGDATKESLDYLDRVYLRQEEPASTVRGYRPSTLKNLGIILSDMALDHARDQ